MKLSKNKKHQYLFFFILSVYTIFNGGNSNILIQINFILISLLFLFCLKDKNYKLHFNIFYKKNKIPIAFYFLFLSYLIFQIIPLPIDILKFFSFEKFNIIKKLHFNTSFSTISLSPTNSFFQFLNFVTLLFLVLIIKMIFYTERHKFRLYFFLSFVGALVSFIAVLLLLNGNPNLFFIDNNYYKDAATGFFINRTVFSVFLVFCLLGSLQYLKMYNFNNKKNHNEIFFKKIYVRLFIFIICIGIITSLSRIGNFLLLATLLFYLTEHYYSNKVENNSFRNIIFLVIIFDILLAGFYFGADQLIERFLFLNEQLVYESSEGESFTRIQIINFGLDNIKKFYLFGYGLGGFETLFQIYSNITNDKFANHAHSDLVQLFGELGLFGFILLNISFFKFFYNNFFSNSLNYLLIFFIIIFLLFDFSLHIPVIQILFIMFFILDKKNY